MVQSLKQPSAPAVIMYPEVACLLTQVTLLSCATKVKFSEVVFSCTRTVPSPMPVNRQFESRIELQGAAGNCNDCGCFISFQQGVNF